MITKYVKNENLPTIKPDWEGTPVDEKKQFVNAEFPYLPKFIKLLQWQLGKNPQSAEKANDKERLQVFDPLEFLQGEQDGILWLGHASFFIRLSGANILLDPVFGKPSFLKRLMDVPSPLKKLKKIDFILISHDHRDHADEATIKDLTQKFPKAEILAGLKMDGLLNAWKTPTNNVQTAGWYQQFETKNSSLKITFLPARHWARRGLFDTNKRLWGAFMIQDSAQRTIYFSGDTGYGGHFKELIKIFPPIDYFIIGIGAYSPRWFMKPVHISPEDAFQGFLESKAKHLIPMHFGTFDLTNEPPSEPLRLLKETAEKSGIINKIKVLQINESLNF